MQCDFTPAAAARAAVGHRIFNKHSFHGVSHCSSPTLHRPEASSIGDLACTSVVPSTVLPGSYRTRLVGHVCVSGEGFTLSTLKGV